MAIRDISEPIKRQVLLKDEAGGVAPAIRQEKVRSLGKLRTNWGRKCAASYS
jgi:hypothetical protein